MVAHLGTITVGVEPTTARLGGERSSTELRDPALQGEARGRLACVRR
jgi:hypothetical protein